jgi:hypothetical protein
MTRSSRRVYTLASTLFLALIGMGLLIALAALAVSLLFDGQPLQGIGIALATLALFSLGVAVLVEFMD